MQELVRWKAGRAAGFVVMLADLARVQHDFAVQRKKLWQDAAAEFGTPASSSSR